MTLNELIEKVGGLGPAVVLILVCLNTLLSALSLILDKIKDFTPTDTDNKAADALHGVLTAIQKILDFLSANVKHK